MDIVNDLGSDEALPFVVKLGHRKSIFKRLAAEQKRDISQGRRMQLLSVCYSLMAAF